MDECEPLNLGNIPFKGAVLNQTSTWWFNNTKHIVPNAWLSSPDPNVTIMRKCEVGQCRLNR